MTQTKTWQFTITMTVKQWSAWQTKPKNTIRSTKYKRNNGDTKDAIKIAWWKPQQRSLSDRDCPIDIWDICPILPSTCFHPNTPIPTVASPCSFPHLSSHSNSHTHIHMLPFPHLQPHAALQNTAVPTLPSPCLSVKFRSEFCRILNSVGNYCQSDQNQVPMFCFFLIFTRPEPINLDQRCDTRMCRSKSELFCNHTNGILEISSC